MSGVLIKGIVPSKFLEFFFDGVYFYPNLCKVEGFIGQTESPPLSFARRNDPFELDDFKFFVPLLAELRASLGLAANSFFLYIYHINSHESHNIKTA